jgi:hypothetical protein
LMRGASKRLLHPAIHYDHGLGKSWPPRSSLMKNWHDHRAQKAKRRKEPA